MGVVVLGVWWCCGFGGVVGLAVLWVWRCCGCGSMSVVGVSLGDLVCELRAIPNCTFNHLMATKRTI